MGFTATMDDFDVARYAQGPSPLPGSPVRPRHAARAAGEGAVSAPSWLREEVDVVETVLPPHGAGAPVKVQGLTAGGRIRVRAEMQLLAALEVAGALAVPGIVSIEDDGYVRESAPSLDPRGGRRAAEFGTPATAERAGTRRARDQLDALVDALHQRGWVLGAEDGQGVGLREDGTVVVLDLRGLMPHDDLASCRADRRWVDSVLTDSERTLRRRIQEPGPAGLYGGLAPEGAEPAAELADTAPRGTPGAIPAPRDVGHSEPAAVRPVVRAGQHLAPAAQRSPDPSIPSIPSGPSGPSGPSDRSRETRGRLRRFLPRLREPLLARRSRRTVLTTAAAVLLAGSVLGTGTWLVMPSTGHQPSDRATGADGATAPAPPIDDAWALAAELAGARHAYVTGLSSQPIATPGSDALTADIAVRAAYEGYTVDGGGPVIHEAEVLEEPTAEGTALLRVLTSSEEAELVAADGSRRLVPATAQESIELEIRWDGTGWKVQSTRPTPGSARG